MKKGARGALVPSKKELNGVCRTKMGSAWPKWGFFRVWSFRSVFSVVFINGIQAVADLRRRPKGAMAPPEGGNSN